jgi:glycerol-3-phosphate dehydrogenase
MKRFQIAIIGAGVVGSAIARELSWHNVSVCVLEAGSDACSGTSKANSGVIHSGINSKPGSLKARFCVDGNYLIQVMAGELGIETRMVGKLVVARKAAELAEVERLKKVGEENGVPGLLILNAEEAKEREPNIECEAALWVPTAGIILPYQFTIALAECAAINGVQFMLDTPVTGLSKNEDGFIIQTPKGEFEADLVINTAGVNCGRISEMIEKVGFEVHPCRGEYLVLDKAYEDLVNSMIYPVPPEGGGFLGIHITPTIEGNILLGPSAEHVEDGEDVRTTASVMKMLLDDARKIIPSIPNNGAINTYAGMRCKLSETEWSDYLIGESDQTPGLFHLAGIESPGLTAAPAIAMHVAGWVASKIELGEKGGWIRSIDRIARFSSMTEEERKKAITDNPAYGRIVCRCEHVSEAEIISALDNPLGARTIAGVKYRVRAGMGRCQGGFCTQHIVRIMEQEFGMKPEQIKLKSNGSNLFTGKTREQGCDGNE